MEAYRGRGQRRENSDSFQPKILRQEDRENSPKGIDSSRRNVSNSGRIPKRTSFGEENEERSDGLSQDRKSFWNDFGDGGQIISDSDGDHCSRREQISDRDRRSPLPDSPRYDRKISDSDKTGLQRGIGVRTPTGKRESFGYFTECSKRTTQSELGFVAYGIPARLASGQVWDSEPGGVSRVAHGVKGRVSALKAIGNSVVPEVVTIPLMRVAEILEEL